MDGEDTQTQGAAPQPQEPAQQPQEPAPQPQPQTEDKPFDWFDPKQYGVDGLPREQQEKVTQAVKGMQAQWTKKHQEIKGQQKKYGFNSMDELVSMLESDKELQRLANERSEKAASVNKMVEDPSDMDMGEVAGNWSALNQKQQQATWAALSREQQTALRHELELNAIRTERQQEKYQNLVQSMSQLDAENQKTYGEDYKTLNPQIGEFLQNPPVNVRALAFKVLNYENHGKKMYEKGLKERGAMVDRLNAANGFQGSGVQETSDSPSRDIMDDFQKALKQHNVTLDEFSRMTI
jgi:hypothetical protein